MVQMKFHLATYHFYHQLFYQYTFLIFFVWSRLQTTYLGYQISQANNEQEQLLNLNKKLKLEVASLQSLSRIENIAKNQLGLVNPKPHQMVFMK